jgi:ribosomal protein S18 acetylase RimI-like enzyme
MSENEYQIRTVQVTDRSRLATLIHFGTHIHQHLDWKTALDWIGSTPYLLVENNEEVLASIACIPELPDTAWIRLFACSALIGPSKAWEVLWDATHEALRKAGCPSVAVISLQSWINELLTKSGFLNTDDVVVLVWEKPTRFPAASAKLCRIRPMLPEDLQAVTAIDHAAFDPIWRNSQDSLELAYQQSSMMSVAEYGDEIVGYQFSTMSAMGGHLARLAVVPAMQGKGIGYLLVHDVLSQLIKRGTEYMTVNTQKNNKASLALYAKAGFNHTGETYRVFKYDIPD